MEKPTIDLYQCQFLKSRSSQKDFPANTDRSICAGLDLVNFQGQIAYYDWTKQEYQVLNCTLPWKTWKMETLQDGQLLEDCLKGLVYYFADQKLGTLDALGLIVPYSFSAFQQSMIRKIAKNAGIQKVAMDSAGMYSCMAMHFSDKIQKEGFLDLIFQYQEHSFEISMIEVADGVFESLGTVAITSEGGWSHMSAEAFEKRISGELTQFFRDLGFEKLPDGSLKNPNPSLREFRVYSCGEPNAQVEKILASLTGRMPEGTYGIPAFGGMIQGLKWQGASCTNDILRLSTWNKNLWVSLGDNGEKGIVINRYRTLSTREAASLLLSTETRLRIYEGNYFNPAYDKQLLEIELGDLTVEEGKEISCELDIDFLGKIQVTVTNHRNECIIDHYEI